MCVNLDFFSESRKKKENNNVKGRSSFIIAVKNRQKNNHTINMERFDRYDIVSIFPSALIGWF